MNFRATFSKCKKRSTPPEGFELLDERSACTLRTVTAALALPDERSACTLRTVTAALELPDA